MVTCCVLCGRAAGSRVPEARGPHHSDVVGQDWFSAGREVIEAPVLAEHKSLRKYIVRSCMPDRNGLACSAFQSSTAALCYASGQQSREGMRLWGCHSLQSLVQYWLRLTL